MLARSIDRFSDASVHTEGDPVSKGFQRLSIRHIWKQPLPYQKGDSITRLILRSVGTVAGMQVTGIHGDLSQIAPERDPFVVVLNHNQRLEAVLIPCLLFLLRQGKPVHFMADWNFMMAPVVASMYRHSQVILVTKKDARPRFLNKLKPLFEESLTPMDQALKYLHSGASVGIFPEGTMNRDPEKMMRGLPGAATLSLTACCPVIPMGIRFPFHDPSRPITDGAKMSLHVGQAVQPPRIQGTPSSREILRFHAHTMNALSHLCGKSWHPNANKRRKYVS
ncbi:MAG: lysophospholipid acyltransferase family protein [Acidobacteriota bacterium]|nr:lysophospholipid acyltransferase family protein [Acidobacteriota bacterium]